MMCDDDAMIKSHRGGFTPHDSIMREKSDMTAKMLTPKEVAAKFSTDAKTLRKFLRKDMTDKAPGKGARWEIPATSLKSLQKRFDAWNATNHAKATETVEPTEPDTEDEALIDEEIALDNE